ncbi:anti-sigma factor [Nocardioides montaniterrae]
MNRPPTFAELADWAEGRLAPDRQVAVHERLRQDPEARRSVEWIGGFIEAARLLPLVTPEPGLVDRLKALFDAPQRLGGPWTEAHLLYDTAVFGVSGVRFDLGPGERHLAFESKIGRFVVEVITTAREQYVDVAGLLLLGGGGGAEISLLEDGVARKLVHTDNHGAFAIHDVPTSVDELRIVAGEDHVRLRLDLQLP